MNKKKFQKELKKIRKNGYFSLQFIDNLLRNDKKSFFYNEKIEKLVGNNFQTLMQYTTRGNVDSFVNSLCAQEKMKPFMEKDSTIKYILDTVKSDDFDLIVNDSALKKQSQNFIHNNLDYVLKNYPIKKIVPIYENMKLNEEETGKMDKYFNSKKREFLQETLTKTLSFSGKIDKKELNTLLDVVGHVVNKTLEKENCKITDVKILMGGAFSNVLSIGNSVIKVGTPRETFDIPNDKRILQPHLRRDLNKDYGVNATIEVSDRVDTNISLSEDELYDIYKDIRDRGIVCGDFKYDNIGKLLKPNVPRNMESNGMIGKVNETLKVGDYVLIDTDFIYREDDPSLVLGSDMSRKFEKRYKNDKIELKENAINVCKVK